MILRSATISGFKWSGVSQVVGQIIQLITTIVLARLLVPSDFGLISMVSVVVGFLMLFNDLGTSTAIIQHHQPSQLLLTSVFWLNIGFGILVTLLIIALAPLLGWFYQETQIVPLLQVISVTFALSGVSTLQQSMLQRSMDFDVIAKIEIVSIFVGSLTAIGSAFFGQGVWSFVYQSIAFSLVRTLFLWRSTDWHPSLTFHWNEVKTVGSFSLNLTGFNIVNYFARNIDYVIIGRFFGSQVLGYYMLAYRLMLYPIHSFTGIANRVMLPVYAQLQNDHARFGSVYLRIVGTIATFTFPLMLGLTSLAEPFTLTVFGMQWQPSILLIIILSPVGMIQSIISTNGSVFAAKGRTDLLFRTGGIAVICIISAFIIGMKWEVVGMAIAYAIVYTILFYPIVVIPLALIDLKMSALWITLWRPLASSLIMVAVIFAMKFVLPAHWSNLLVLVITIPVGCLVYALASWYINREQILTLWSIITKRAIP